MREIKFRAWNKKFKEFKFMSLINYLGGRGIMDDWADSEHSVWEQYTGLKDFNGVEIYEGDIIIPFGVPTAENQVVSFKNGSYVQISNIFGSVALKECQYDFKVIGNIHENADLLEEI